MRKYQMFLEITDLTIFYGKAVALRGISLEVHEGEIVTLIGANGAGKTTTLNAISGLLKPTSGQMWFEGQRVDGLKPHKIARLKIGLVPEGRRVFGPMTVLENLEMGAYLVTDKSEITRRIRNIYKYFPVLEERTHQAAGSLSGGEQQMLAIARSLMGDPKLMLMDEPSMGLAPLMVQEVARIVKVINQSGVSILLVEQNARMALSLANRGYVLEVGSITAQGNAKDLLNNAQVKKAYLGV
jgi:branched-chain amino acid transport system ATP-binding protein